MNFSQKIEEWIAEAEARPASALMILKLVANRLNELNWRNEELLAENIALQGETRVQEYQQRIAHLEYQLELLKRRAGNPALEETPPAQPCLLAFDPLGRLARLDGEFSLQREWLLKGDPDPAGEWPRLLAAACDDDLLAFFTSGRVETLSLAALPSAPAAAAWETLPQPQPPRPGERLTSFLSLTSLPLMDFFLQVSRRAVLKKTPVSLSESVLAKHFLGRAVLEKNDQPFSLCLARKNSRLALVSYEGRLAVVSVDDLPFTMQEHLRLPVSDFIVAAFPLEENQTLLCLTQNGKVIAREAKSLNITPAGRGQSLIPPARLAAGTRFIGAVLTSSAADTLAALDSSGRLRLFSAQQALSAGALPAQAVWLSLGLLPAAG